MIRGYSPRVRNLADAIELRDVVSALRFEHLDPAGREMTDIGNFQRRKHDISIRLDRQPNPTSGGANLQIQVNNAALARISLNPSEGTTIAQVLVPASVYQAAFACHEHNVRTHLENVVRGALLASAESAGVQFVIATRA
jgi:hypothetical protein